jgi:hypothetical protein
VFTEEMNALRMRTRLLTALAATCVVALAMSACGGGGDDSSTTALKPDVDRYCQLLKELSDNTNQAYNDLQASLPDTTPTADQLAATQRQINEDNADLINELRQVAPTSIQDDFNLSADSAIERANAGDAGRPPKDVIDATERLAKFAKQSCGLNTT